LKKTVGIRQTFFEKWTFLKMSKNEKKFWEFSKNFQKLTFTAYTGEKRRITFLVCDDNKKFGKIPAFFSVSFI
jgi:hypothetical protein